MYRTYATRGGVNPITGDSLRPQALFGHGPDFGYFYAGTIWYGDEIWNGGREKDYDKNGRIEQWEVLRYCDEAFAGKCFMPWKKFPHPQLGEVEIGGFNPKFWSQNPPPEMLETWARNEAMFNVYLAQQLPQVKIVSASSKPAGDGAFDVSMTVTSLAEFLMPQRRRIVAPRSLVRIAASLAFAVAFVDAEPEDKVASDEAPARIAVSEVGQFSLEGQDSPCLFDRSPGGGDIFDDALQLDFTHS